MLASLTSKVVLGALLAIGLTVVGLGAAGLNAAKDKEKGDCCAQKLACCSDSACCKAEKKAGCCTNGAKCCAEDKGCCESAPKCCQEGKACCDEAKECCKEEAKKSACCPPSKGTALSAEASNDVPACCRVAVAR